MRRMRVGSADTLSRRGRVTRVEFSVRYAAEDPSHRLRLVGSGEALGGWDIHRGVDMKSGSQDPSQWTVEVDLATSAYVTYKYVLVQMKSPPSEAGSEPSPMRPFPEPAELVRWEPFHSNRSLKVEGLAMRVNDRDFGTFFNVMNEARVRVDHGHIFGEWDPPAPLDKRRDVSLYHEQNARNVLIVLYRLPILARRGEDGTWSFKWDDDALYMTSLGLRRGLNAKAKVTWVGIINTDEEIRDSEKAAMSRVLLEDFGCVPVYVPKQTLRMFYEGFCKGVLWPLFHMYNNVVDRNGNTRMYDKALWLEYLRVNRLFASVVIDEYQEGNLIWIHDYHLMVLPAQLRLRLAGAKIGFYLHIPWPSSEVYRAFPQRDEILTGLLSSTLLGFHLFDYARHFLSACVRLLNLEHESKRGSIGVDYMGRHVLIRVSHIGADPARFQESLDSEPVLLEVEKLRLRHPNQTILGAVDDLDIFKGITLKLRAFETLLSRHEEYRGKLTLVQVALPKKVPLEDGVEEEIKDLVKRISDKFGTSSYAPVVYREENISFDERIALYRNSDALLLTPVRDGLNLVPYEYILSSAKGKGQLILSEATGCSRALSGAIRLNPWNEDEIVSSIKTALESDEQTRLLKQDVDYEYVMKHSTASWAESFLADLERADEPRTKGKKLGLGLKVSYGLLDFDGFERLDTAEVLMRYQQSKRRLFLLDYDGTLVSGSCSTRVGSLKKPDELVVKYLEAIAQDTNNTIFIMSGRTRDELETTFAGMNHIGLAAEHGFYFRYPYQAEWQRLDSDDDLAWMEVARDIMEEYEDKTDGAWIEQRTAGLVWHFLDADPQFGSWQAKELHDHLESMLGAFNIQVVAVSGSLQVRLASVNKGTMVQRIVGDTATEEDPDFVLCIGDDRTDEDMFAFLARRFDADLGDGIFSCTVGVKPSDARYYLGSSDEVISLLGAVARRKQRPETPGTNLSALVSSRTFSDFRHPGETVLD